VGLEDLANEEARNLPYGKQRSLEIARALALDPELLLLDEPAAGLTAPDIKELLRIIRKVRDSGITFKTVSLVLRRASTNPSSVKQSLPVVKKQMRLMIPSASLVRSTIKMQALNF